MGFRQALMNPYDAIILDLNLVESDGMNLLYGLRKRKPYIPVVIITGYPSDETRRTSSTLGVIDYVTKPFGPDDILKPVERILASEGTTGEKETDLPVKERKEINYHFYHSSWFYQIENGTTRVGGYLTNLSDNSILSVKLPEAGQHIKRGAPLAEVTLSDGTKQVIRSAICGKITEVNNNLQEHYYNLEKNLHHKSWIARVEPDRIEEDLRSTETRSVLVFTDENMEENEFYQRIYHQGYKTRITGRMDEVLQILSREKIRLLVMDAGRMGELGPKYVKMINREMPGVRIIVFNEPNLQLERMFRKNNIFYYGVNPILNNELIDLLHCAFSDES
jgi:DNA-binding NtrC family response regulator